jgi:hypothetical protein
MVIKDVCPQCRSPKYKRNGPMHSGKQNHQCKVCGRQFVECFEQHVISDNTRALEEGSLCWPIQHRRALFRGPTLGRPPATLRGYGHTAVMVRGQRGCGKGVYSGLSSIMELEGENFQPRSELDCCPFPQPRMVMKIANHGRSWGNSRNRADR